MWNTFPYETYINWESYNLHKNYDKNQFKKEEKKKKKNLSIPPHTQTLGIFNLQGNAQDTLHRQKSPDQAQDNAEDLPQPVNHIKKFILFKQNKFIVFVGIC